MAFERQEDCETLKMNTLLTSELNNATSTLFIRNQLVRMISLSLNYIILLKRVFQLMRALNDGTLNYVE